MKIWTVDAFATEPYTGNPAAVTVVEEFPTDHECQNIAAEMNLSETAFVKPLQQNHFHIRWFTPTKEVKLCGHATLASAHILHQENIATNNRIHFESLSGPLFVYKNEDSLSLDFPLQKTGPQLPLQQFKLMLNTKISNAEQALDDVIVELPDANILKHLQVDSEKVKQLDCRGLIITAKSSDKYDFLSRFFAPRYGVNEDPVTGSAHCKLADYWQKRLNKNKLLAYQASKRGGEIQIEIKNDRVLLTGNAITIMQGKWLVMPNE